MTAKHTPGPWTYTEEELDARVRASDGRTFMIGDVLYHPDNRANARLIAAAPDLLSFMRVMLEYLEGGEIGITSRDIDEKAMLGELRAVIARAEGGAP